MHNQSRYPTALRSIKSRLADGRITPHELELTADILKPQDIPHNKCCCCTDAYSVSTWSVFDRVAVDLYSYQPMYRGTPPTTRLLDMLDLRTNRCDLQTLRSIRQTNEPL